MSAERWLPIPGYEGFYEVSDAGRVRSLHRGQVYILNPSPTHRGHLRVALFLNRRRRTRKVHQLVLLAFVGQRPEGMQSLHRNDVKTDNRLVNLRYGTPSENQLDAVRHGLHHQATKTHCAKGHPFDEANTYYPTASPTQTHRRSCRQCTRDYQRAWYLQNRATEAFRARAAS